MKSNFSQRKIVQLSGETVNFIYLLLMTLDAWESEGQKLVSALSMDKLIYNYDDLTQAIISEYKQRTAHCKKALRRTKLFITV